MGSSHVFIDESAYLEHFGVLGMKWGRRKAKGSSSGPSKSKKTKSTRDPSNVELRRIQKKKPSEMSNDELRRANERLNLETQYRQLNSRDMSSGKTWVKNAAILAGTTAVTVVASKYANQGADFLARNIKKGAGYALTNALTLHH